MEQEFNTKEMIQEAIKKGSILGVIHIVVFMLLYLLAPSKLTGFSYVAAILVINIGYCIYEGIRFRNEIGGFMTYGKAFQYSFIILAANGLVGVVFMALFILIDPSFPEMMAQNQLDTSVYWAQRFGAPAESLDQLEDNFNKEDILANYSAFGFVKGYGIGLIFYALGGLIVAIFSKKSEPEPTF
ncbi:MAG: DUF4199 domain-containing protein [Imperialibacter sp.]